MPPAQKPLRKYCTTREAAEILGISLKTAQLWSENGLLEAWRTAGGHRRIHRDSVERLLFNTDAGAREAEASTATNDVFRVLIAEGDEARRMLYAQRLSAWKFKPELTLAASGVEALLMIGGNVPDLFITDVVMPEMDGLRMLWTLRGMPALARMAIAVVTELDAAAIQARGGLPRDISLLAKSASFDEIDQIAQAVARSRSVGWKG